ncbi:MAG: hypothetical protein GKR87_08080 [Kiritimatiellae bacterium]|nr:hypothetical protein [Kiritimatiellia bacterium]
MRLKYSDHQQKNKSLRKKYHFFEILRTFLLLCIGMAVVSCHVFQGDPSSGDSSIQPFEEIGASLGFRGENHSVMHLMGPTLFDANGDGRLDLYIPHSGRPRPKTTPNGVLSRQTVPPIPCALFLNRGNDAKGNPIFKSVEELMADGNREHVKEELLIENKYRPRTRIDEDEFLPGRIGSAAAPADFNGDGKIDLYVCNSHYGLLHSNEKLGVPVYPAQENIGRATRSSNDVLIATMPPFLQEKLEDGLNITVDFGEKPEPEGRNSLYLNLGDRDGDGIPEWKDITEQAGVGGKWASVGATVADIDRDGDLDLYVCNFIDPDFYGFGISRFAGNRNQLYVNQLVETGTLTFKEMALEKKVAGLHDEEQLPHTSYFPPGLRSGATCLRTYT